MKYYIRLNSIINDYKKMHSDISKSFISYFYFIKTTILIDWWPSKQYNNHRKNMLLL